MRTITLSLATNSHDVQTYTQSLFQSRWCDLIAFLLRLVGGMKL